MKVYGQLQKAQFENLAAAPGALSLGMFYWDTVLNQARLCIMDRYFECKR